MIDDSAVDSIGRSDESCYASKWITKDVFTVGVSIVILLRETGERWLTNDYPFLMKSDDGSMGSIGERCGMGDDGVGGDDRCSGDNRRGLQNRCGIGDRGGHERALHRHLVGVGVAGGNRDGVGDRDRGRRRDDRRRVEGGRRQVAGCRCGRGASQQSEESDDLVHGVLLVRCFGLRRNTEERVMPERGV